MNAVGHVAYGGWVESLRSSDAGQLWRQLHRLVRDHPLARAHHGPSPAWWMGADTCDDLTQELFVTLPGKDRFRHYLLAGMTDREIETEIAQIDLTNLLTSRLRKRYPESYRLAMRVPVLLQKSRRFLRFDKAGGDVGHHVRLSNQVYGLRRWPAGTSTLPTSELERPWPPCPCGGAT